MAKRGNTKAGNNRGRTSTRATGKRAGGARSASRENSPRTKTNALHEPSRPGREVGGKGDFGIPASKARGPTKAGGRGKDRDRATGPTRGGVDSRETGVGAP